jgi:tRNA-splicing ligase RtcB (3'-phosphate/5'-hydroxy nucleic acid ligase)
MMADPEGIMATRRPFVFGTHDEKTLAQLADVASRAERAALMADGHLGYVMPIGGVAAYREKVSVVGVGFDIACGNAAIMTDMTVADLSSPGKIADDIQRSISFGVGRTNNHDDPSLTEHSIFKSPAWDALPKAAKKPRLQEKAKAQLGTVGSGNHYVDVFSDELGRVWVGVHFGSRGLGHTIASGFLALSQGKEWGSKVPEREALLDLATPMGEGYWGLMSLAGEYAYAGREWVARKVVQILGAKELDLVHNHHNFAWKEKQWIGEESDELVVVRKGATPAFPGQRSFVGGSMGDDSVILEGATASTETDPVREAQKAAMFSTVHGAGRVMSRTQAAGKSKGWGHKRVRVAPGLISQEMQDEWLQKKGVILRGGGLDEAPQAYRRLPDVIAAQGATVKVLHTLKPLIVVMAGESEHDPYKD